MHHEGRMQKVFDKYGISTRDIPHNISNEEKLKLFHANLAQVFNNSKALSDEDKKIICEFLKFYKGVTYQRSQYYDSPIMENCE